jgi:aminomethyltransferase
MTNLQRTALFPAHEAAGAKFADFGGWDMPIEYLGTVAEHTAVRESVGLFDVSHMGKVAVFGPGATRFVNSVVVNDLDRIGPGQAQYSMLCAEDGGIIDDLIIYKWNDDGVYIIPNAANSGVVVSVLREFAPAGVTIDDQQLTHGIIAVQGPASADVVAALGLPTGMDYMAFEMAHWHDSPITVCRSGYTGERGYELIAPNPVLPELWAELVKEAIERGGMAAGLGARDTLRTEMGYPLHGNDISVTTNPVEAGLSWAVGWAKPEFLGHEVIRSVKEAGPARRLRALKMLERGIPRAHMQVLRNGEAIGETTSGTYSPTLKAGIALAYLPAGVSEGDTVAIDVRGKIIEAQVVTPPFVPARTR